MEYNKIKTIIVIFILTVGFFTVVVEPAMSFEPPPPPPPDEYIVTITGYWHRVSGRHFDRNRAGQYAIYYNGTRIMAGNVGVGGNDPPPVTFTRSFITIEAIDTIQIVQRRAGRRECDNPFFGEYNLNNAKVTITRLGTVVYSSWGLNHAPNLPPIHIPIPPTPTFNLPPPPVLTPPTTRPAFFNYTVLFPFFDFVDSLFLPFAQTILNILWIPLSLLDFINQTLIGFWYFFDHHVIYGDFLDVLGFLRMFFEIPEIMSIMVFGLALVTIKMYLKR